MRVAIVHEWLDTWAGSEKVLEQLLILYPDADLFVTVDFLPEGARAVLAGRQVRTSVIQRLPFARSRFRSYLPLMPLAVEQHDLSAYDLVISSSHAFAKGVLTSPRQCHLCYCHTPLRYAWDLQHEYLLGSGLNKGVRSWLARAVLHYLRVWDVRTAHGVDRFAANSRYIARRIRKTYGRDSVVIAPPVDTHFYHPAPGPRESFYVTASRLVPYKRVELIVSAFSRMPHRRLVVIGDGPQMRACRDRAGENIEFTGYLRDEELRTYLQRARAFVFAAEEDFGIVPVEAQACGTPVIAFGSGGVLDSVVPEVTGVFYSEQTEEAICLAVNHFDGHRFDEAVIRRKAEEFAPTLFRSRFKEFADQAMAEHWLAGRVSPVAEELGRRCD